MSILATLATLAGLALPAQDPPGLEIVVDGDPVFDADYTSDYYTHLAKEAKIIFVDLNPAVLESVTAKSVSPFRLEIKPEVKVTRNLTTPILRTTVNELGKFRRYITWSLPWSKIKGTISYTLTDRSGKRPKRLSSWKIDALPDRARTGRLVLKKSAPLATGAPDPPEPEFTRSLETAHRLVLAKELPETTREFYPNLATVKVGRAVNRKGTRGKPMLATQLIIHNRTPWPLEFVRVTALYTKSHYWRFWSDPEKEYLYPKTPIQPGKKGVVDRVFDSGLRETKTPTTRGAIIRGIGFPVVPKWHRGPGKDRLGGPEWAVGAPDNEGWRLHFNVVGKETTTKRSIWLSVQFDDPIVPSAIRIVDHINGNAVHRVTGFDRNNVETEVWAGRRLFKSKTADIPLTAKHPLHRVRIFMNVGEGVSYGLDAVGLVDKAGKVHWADAAATNFKRE